MTRKYSAETLLSRWEDRRACQNLMGRFSTSYVIRQEALIYERFWSGRDDVCLGLNDGWYSGKDAVKGYYDALKARDDLYTEVIVARFPDAFEGKTPEELHNVGMLGYKPIDTCVMEVAGDGETARGVWTVRGGYDYLTVGGSVGNWEWSYLFVDFIRENGEWKIWHLQNLFDVDHPSACGLSEEYNYPAPAEGFEKIGEFKMPEPNVPVKLWEYYSGSRPRMALPELPVPYHTFAETESYGIGGADA